MPSKGQHERLLLAIVVDSTGKRLQPAKRSNWFQFSFRFSNQLLNQNWIKVSYRRRCGDRGHGWLVTAGLDCLQSDIGVSESRGILQGWTDLQAKRIVKRSRNLTFAFDLLTALVRGKYSRRGGSICLAVSACVFTTGASSARECLIGDRVA